MKLYEVEGHAFDIWNVNVLYVAETLEGFGLFIWFKADAKQLIIEFSDKEKALSEYRKLFDELSKT